jgi:hypothetical protein
MQLQKPITTSSMLIQGLSTAININASIGSLPKSPDGIQMHAMAVTMA